MYSALKVNGKKLYELARAGIEVERKARPIDIMEIKILNIQLPQVILEVTCSKGTYIRTLCHDIGQKLGVGGTMKELTRTRVERFQIEDALTLSEVEAMVVDGSLVHHLLHLEDIFGSIPKVVIPAALDRQLLNGNRLQLSDTYVPGTQVRMYDSENHFKGIYVKQQDDFRPVKMFLGS